jgi:hypothetical protein
MVSVLNKSTVVTDDEVSKIVAATNLVLSRDFAPDYERLGPDQGHWKCRVGGHDRIQSVLVDEDKDVPGALAYHDLTDGRPILVTMAKTILDSGGTTFGPDGVLSAHLHEVEETFNDAACNLIARGPDGKYRWREVCDAVQGEDYEITPGSGMYAPNYCKAHWFNPDSPDQDLDFQHSRTEPFQVAPHGYQVVADCGPETQVGGELPIIVDADGQQRGAGPNAWRTLRITGISGI